MGPFWECGPDARREPSTVHKLPKLPRFEVLTYSTKRSNRNLNRQVSSFEIERRQLLCVCFIV
jgi:hypothetical protein